MKVHMEGEGELMKIKYIVSVGSLVAMLSGGACAGTFVNDGFSGSLGDPLSSRVPQWGATASVMLSNKTHTADGSLSVAIPILQTLSNVAALGSSGTNVWTDFWTIPRPFVSASDAAPAVDLNSSAMFFVTNQYWAVVYGAGGSDTNVCESGIGIGANPQPVANDGLNWHRVSVLHNYKAQKWSLFVDGVPLKTNMTFISTVPTTYEWFAVQNGGGAASNVTWIDEVLITNRVPPGLTNSFDGDSMSDAWELMYFGNFNADSNAVQPNGFNNAQLAVLEANPFVVSASEPGGASRAEYVFGDTNAFVSAAPPTVGSPNLNLTFQVVSNRLYRVLGSTTYNGAFSDPRFTFVTDASGQTSQTDKNILMSDSMNYYYRLVAETTNRGVVFMETNAITYAVHVQPRTPTSSSNYWIGITVDYGTNNTLNSTLGTQLAQGLHRGSDGDLLTVYWPNPSSPTLFRLAVGGWTPVSGTTLSVSSNIPFGAGMLIQKQVYDAVKDGTRSVFAGPMVTAAPGIRLEPNWNMVAWPYEGSNSVETLSADVGQPSDSIATADRIWIYRNGQYKQLRRWATGGWQFEPRTASSPMETSWGYLQQGEAVFYWNAASSGGIWTP